MGGSQEKQLLEAVQSADAAGVQAAIAGGADPNSTLDAGRTALMLAARGGRVPVVRVLLAAGADALETDEGGETALAWTVTPRYLSTGRRWLDRVGLKALRAVFGSPKITGEDEAKTPEQADAAAAITKDLIEAGALVRVRNKQGETPLHLAARTGCTEAAAAMIAAGADVHAVDAAGASPIVDAASRNHWDIVDEIVAADSDAVPRPTVVEVLHMAAARNRTAAVTSLLRVVPSLDAEEAMPVAAWAAAEGHDALLDRVLALRPDPRVAGKALLGGIAGGHRQIVEVALAAGASADIRDEDGRRALASAQPGAVDALLEAGADPNLADDRGWTPLMYAAGRQDAWAVMRMLAAGASPGARAPDGTTVLDAAAAGASEPSRGLLENWDSSWVGEVLRRAMELEDASSTMGPHDEVRGVPVLLAAAEIGRADLIARLVGEGVELDVRGPQDETPLMRAAQWGHLAAMDALLSGGADPRARSAGGETVLMWAGSRGAVEALVAAGADPGARDATGVTPLIGAMRRLRDPKVPITADSGERVVGDLPGLVAALLEAGRDVAGQDDDGRTALAVAITTGGDFREGGTMRRIVRLLIDHGADVDRADDSGTTPLMLAADRCDRHAIEMLLSAGADVHRRDASGRSALGRTAHCGSDAPKKLLTDAGAP